MRDRYNLRWRGRFAFYTGFLALGLLISLLGVWGTQAKIAGAVIAPGLIKVESSRQVVQHADGGIVTTIYVRDGDYVEAGQTLLQLDDTDIRSELMVTEQQLVDTTARIARLKAERNDASDFRVGLPEVFLVKVDDIVADQYHLFETRRASFDNEIAQMQEQIIQFREQVKGVNAQIEALHIQVALLNEEITPYKKLVELGIATRLKLLEPERNRARLQGELGRLVAL
tara:strand:- start:45 stop:728 length:684 start_codon:yes stop_codon:yes gene_type:complete